MKLTENKLRKIVRNEIKKAVEINEDFTEDRGLQSALDELKYNAGVHQAFEDLSSILVSSLPSPYQKQIAKEIYERLNF